MSFESSSFKDVRVIYRGKCAKIFSRESLENFWHQQMSWVGIKENDFTGSLRIFGLNE